MSFQRKESQGLFENLSRDCCPLRLRGSNRGMHGCLRRWNKLKCQLKAALVNRTTGPSQLLPVSAVAPTATRCTLSAYTRKVKQKLRDDIVHKPRIHKFFLARGKPPYWTIERVLGKVGLELITFYGVKYERF